MQVEVRNGVHKGNRSFVDALGEVLLANRY